jgi:hypothetical protein
MGLIAYPPVYDAKRVLPLRKSLPIRHPKPKSVVDPATRAQIAMEQMNRLGIKTLRSRFLPAPLLEIVKKVAQERGISVMLIAGNSRKVAAVRARNEAMYLIKEARPHLSAPRIARWFDRDHTSVLHGISSHAAKNDLPKLVGYDFERVRKRNARIAAELRATRKAAARDSMKSTDTSKTW